jgi:magnesium-transporting ATPase (P-type)
MAIDPLHWSKWSPHVGNAITIATGIPTVIGMLAGLWAYVSLSGPPIVLAIVALAVFMMTLWCCIGVLWLVNRSRNSSFGDPRLVDCSWGLRVDSAALCHDVANTKAE